jgi:hypothetical protein
MGYHKQDDAFYDWDKHDVALDSCHWKCPWPADEMNQLLMDAEEMEMERDDMAIKMTRARDNANRAQHQTRKAQASLSSHRREVAEEFDGVNKDLTSKCLIYLDLIKEYEIIIKKYSGYNGMKLTTTAIQNLRRRGGLIT